MQGYTNNYNYNFDGFVKSLILCAPLTILQLMTHLTKRATAQANILEKHEIFSVGFIMEIYFPPKAGLDTACKRLLAKAFVLNCCICRRAITGGQIYEKYA